MVCLIIKGALKDGKKLKTAKIAIARGDETWTFTLDADMFCFKSMKLPDGTEFQYKARFIERLESLYIFKEAFFTLYGEFVKRFGGENRSAHIDKMKDWLAEREGNVIHTEVFETT